MIKKTVMWVCGFVFVVFLPSPAFADQSIGFQHYFNEGVKAFKEHDDQKAIRCFKIAEIYDPSDEELNKYIDILSKKGVALELPLPQPSREIIEYRYYFSEAVKASRKHDDKKAARYFKIARIFNPDSKEVGSNLEIVYQRHGVEFPVENQPLLVEVPSIPIAPQAVAEVPPVVPQTQQPYIPESEEPKQEAVVPQPALYVPVQKINGPIPVVSLAQLTNNGQIKPKLQIEYHSSVVVEGTNIHRFLVVDDGFIAVKMIDVNRLEIDAQGIGSTFLHIWDDAGLHTLYIEIVFPKPANSSLPGAMNNGVQHSKPFVVTYTNDWDTYYSGKNIPGLKRQSYDFQQTLAVSGETPYGFLDTSGSYIDFDSFSEFDTYTIGLSQIPLEGTSNFNLRGFDALRYLSPLTMPGTRLRGAFADVDLMDDLLGLSVSHGQEQVPLGFISMGQQTQFNNSYIDAAKLTLFPKSSTDRYSFNFATGYGPDRQPYLSDHVYSVEGQHKFNDYLTLNAEQGSDSSHDASLAALNWQDGTFKTGLNFRNIDKNYATVSTLPAYQGETGADWTTEGDFKRFTESTFVEAYRDRLDFNPDDPGAYNYDANGQVRTNITQVWSDSDFNYVDTPGEASPSSSLGLNERLSRSFGIWQSLKGTVFGGAGYQNSHAKDSDISDFDREDVITGIQLPLTHRISSYANYEHNWLDQPDSGGSSNPDVINAGLEYLNQITQKVTFNAQVDYHDELGVKPNSNSFLSGEKSVIVTSGITYNPAPDVNIFLDGDANKTLSHVGNPSYDDFEIHLGMRIAFGGTRYWDPLGTVSGIVFIDKSGIGKFVSGDEGIPGVKMKVGDQEVITDKYGRYQIKVRAKGVLVAPVLDTIPGGLIFSTPQALNVGVLQGRQAHADFGLISQTGIYGLVFVDKKGTGVPHDSDQFVGKVKVILDGKIIQKSDSHGAFYFRKVTPGQHSISIDINSLAINMVPLVKLENKINVAEGSNYMFNIPVQVKQAEEGQD